MHPEQTFEFYDVACSLKITPTTALFALKKQNGTPPYFPAFSKTLFEMCPIEPHIDMFLLSRVSPSLALPH